VRAWKGKSALARCEADRASKARAGPNCLPRRFPAARAARRARSPPAPAPR
jgi:hypothetical protein